MARYILVGGYSSKTPDGGKAFCEELLRGHHPPYKILLCLFARPTDTWNQLLVEAKEFFSQFLSPKDFQMELANPAKFTEQVKWVDIVYIKGGEAEQLLINELGVNRKWVAELKGKTLAGTSVGANAISRYYYSVQDRKVEEGLAILPIKVITHWRSEDSALHVHWDEALLELKNYKEDLPLHTLKEGEFVVIEI